MNKPPMTDGCCDSCGICLIHEGDEHENFCEWVRLQRVNDYLEAGGADSWAFMMILDAVHNPVLAEIWKEDDDMVETTTSHFRNPDKRGVVCGAEDTPANPLTTVTYMPYVTCVSCRNIQKTRDDVRSRSR